MIALLITLTLGAALAALYALTLPLWRYLERML